MGRWRFQFAETSWVAFPFGFGIYAIPGFLRDESVGHSLPVRYLREAVLLRAWTPQQAAQDALNRRDALASAPEEDRAAFYRFAMDMRSEPAL